MPVKKNFCKTGLLFPDVSINALSQRIEFMKKIGILMVTLGFFTACNNTATLENKADSLGKHVDSVGNRVWDSVKVGSKELKERIENQFEKKDTVEK